MALSTTQRIKQAFNLIALRNEAKTLLTGRQWEQRKALVDRCQEARSKAEALYVTRYPARVETTQRRLIDKAATKPREYQPPWAQEDRFDKAETLRLAQWQVRSSHERRIAQINEYERNSLSTLLSSAKRENRLQGKSVQAFAIAKDRRHGGDRRQMHHLKRDR